MLFIFFHEFFSPFGCDYTSKIPFSTVFSANGGMFEIITFLPIFGLI
jgi:hypothetical protein